MSLDSWKKIYYPTPADSAEAQAAPAKHSLRKWEGLRLEVLQQHQIHKSRCSIGGDDGLMLMDDESCALCVRHFAPKTKGDAYCDGCPLLEHLGRNCFQSDASPFRQWGNGNDPEPMIAALKAAVEIEAKAGAK